MKNGTVRLTLKTAKQLIKQEWGFSPAGLIKQDTPADVQIYKMKAGRFEIIVANDWFEHNGLYRMTVSPGASDGLWLFYNPDLTENYEAEDKLREEMKREQYLSYCP